MIIEYRHPELNEEVSGRAGYYCPLEEHVLPYRGRDVLYVLGHACIDNPCCGKGAEWTYIQVPGFLVRRRTAGGTSPGVSEVEIIEDRQTRQDVRDALAAEHRGAQVEIWGTEYKPSVDIPPEAQGAPACRSDTRES